MAHRLHGDAADADRDHRHLDRQRLARPHPRLALRRHRGGHLGDQRLPRRQRDRHPDVRLAQPALRPEELPDRLHRPVHGQLLPVRLGLEPAEPDLLPRPAGHRPAAVSCPVSQSILLEAFPPKQHGVGDGDLRHRRHGRARSSGRIMGGWITDNWSWRWIFYINIPHRRARRRHERHRHPGPALDDAHEDAHRLPGPDLPRRRPRLAAAGPRQGPAGGLVLVGPDRRSSPSSPSSR